VNCIDVPSLLEPIVVILIPESRKKVLAEKPLDLAEGMPSKALPSCSSLLSGMAEFKGRHSETHKTSGQPFQKGLFFFQFPHNSVFPLTFRITATFRRWP
jgi:hypothetical protein